MYFPKAAFSRTYGNTVARTYVRGRELCNVQLLRGSPRGMLPKETFLRELTADHAPWLRDG